MGVRLDTGVTLEAGVILDAGVDAKLGSGICKVALSSMTGEDAIGGILYKNRLEYFRSLRRTRVNYLHPNESRGEAYPRTNFEPRESHRQFVRTLSGGSRKRTTSTVTLSVE